MSGEFAWIRELGERFGHGRLDEALLGIGDDAAVLGPGSPGTETRLAPIVVSVDSQVEDIHFRRDWIGFRDLGRRLLHVGFSDIAAMGAQPWAALVSVEAAPDFTLTDRAGFTDGIADAASELNVRLIGGNVSGRVSGFSAHVTAIGRMLTGVPLLRSSAAPGEDIYVSGALGSAAAARAWLEQPDMQDSPGFCDAYRRPRAHWETGMLLGESGLVGAMIDVSDGLAADLHHLCSASGVGAMIESENLPIAADVRQWCAAHEFDPLTFALGGGEDYVLLFTVKSGKALDGDVHDRLHAKGENLHRIGRTEPGDRVVLRRDGQDKPLHPDGFDHFRRA